MLYFRALHIIGFVAWFAGMFYIWRLFVYHQENPSPEVKEQLLIMARKLYKIILIPAMVFTWIFGLALAGHMGYLTVPQGWFHAKLGLLGLLTIYSFLPGYYIKTLQNGANYSSRRFRLLNEVPTLFLIAIVFLAVLKPF